MKTDKEFERILKSAVEQYVERENAEIKSSIKDSPSLSPEQAHEIWEGLERKLKKARRSRKPRRLIRLGIAAALVVLAFWLTVCGGIGAIQNFFSSALITQQQNMYRYNATQTEVMTQDGLPANAVYYSLQERCPTVTLLIPGYLPQDTVIKEYKSFAEIEQVKITYEFPGGYLKLLQQGKTYFSPERFGIPAEGNTMGSYHNEMLGMDLTYYWVKTEDGAITYTGVWSGTDTGYQIVLVTEDGTLFQRICDSLQLYSK